MSVRIESVSPSELGLEKVGIAKVPAPFFIGRVNAFVIIDEPVTLIDTGIYSTRAREGLLGALDELDVSPKDIGRLIITHGHQDHCGMAAMLKDMNPDMETIVPELETPYFEDYREEFLRVLDFTNQEYHLCGFDPALADAIVDIRKSHLEHSKSFEVSSKVGEGDKIEFSTFNLDVLHTPGHTAGSISLYYPEGEAIFTGDFLYRARVPAPYLEPPLPGKEFKAAISGFLDSLEKTEALNPRLILGGHGPIIDKPDKFIKKMRDFVINKRSEILKIVSEGPTRLADIYERYNNKLDPDNAMIGAADIYSYLEDFRASGDIEREIDNGTAIYRRVR